MDSDGTEIKLIYSNHAVQRSYCRSLENVLPTTLSVWTTQLTPTWGGRWETEVEGVRLVLARLSVGIALVVTCYRPRGGTHE